MRALAQLTLLGIMCCLPTQLQAAETTGSDDHRAPAVGDVIRNFTFKDIRYLPRTLTEFGDKKVFVIVFTTLDCPVVKRYLPRVKELEEMFRDRGVQFLAVNVGPGDPLREVAYQAIRIDAEFPFAKDFDGQAARAVGATRTPQAVVLDGQHRLRYRGRIDSQFRLGGVRPDAGRDDLRLAIEEVLDGREVTVSETPVDGCLISFPDPAPPVQPVTYAEHVAPLLARHCQSCHRPGTEAPFALMTYDDAAAHSAMIAEVVAEQRMPPWFASREHGQFKNERSLTADERRKITDWVRGGCLPGDLSELPPPQEFPGDGWRIGKPDLVIKVPWTTKLPATGYVPYEYAILPYVFMHDTWVQGVQILPSNPATLHHCNMAYAQIGAKFSDANFITGQVPGGAPMRLSGGVGLKIPAGSVLALQIHHVTTGEETTDQISVGICFAKETIQKQLKHVLVKSSGFRIPPGAPHHRVVASRPLDCDATGAGLFAHMHLRGKDMTFRALYADGREETLLVVPNYNFDWQIPYEWEPGKKKFPKGTRIECVAHYDNSAFNPYNPDPTKTITEGQQTFDEMMYGFVFYTDDGEQLNLRIDPETGRVLPPQASTEMK